MSIGGVRCSLGRKRIQFLCTQVKPILPSSLSSQILIELIVIIPNKLIATIFSYNPREKISLTTQKKSSKESARYQEKRLRKRDPPHPNSSHTLQRARKDELSHHPHPSLPTKYNLATTFFHEIVLGQTLGEDQFSS